MSCRIDASLQQGIPSLRLFDARSGKECLFWQQPVTRSEHELRDAWRALFRRLTLLSCIEYAVAGGRPHKQVIHINGYDKGEVTNETAANCPGEKIGRRRQSYVAFLPLRQAGAGR